MSDNDLPGRQPRERLLLLSSGDPDYRGYALRAMGQEFSLVLADKPPFEWQNEHVGTMLPVQPGDADAVLDAVGSLEGTVDGVFTYNEFCVEAAAAVGTRLGLRQNTTETARLCRDKHLMRRAFAEAGVPSAASLPVRDLGEAQEAAARLGYPVVLKPSALAGSIGVVRVDRPEDLAERFAACRGSGHGTYGSAADLLLVEEYLDGPEVSVESVVRDGVVDIVALTRKRLGPAPYFEETGHAVAPGEPDAADPGIRAVAEAAHHALGVRWGATHTELRLTGRGPRVIELAVRPAGDLIPLLVRLATGTDLGCAAAAAMAGREKAPAPQARAGAAAAIRFFYPPHDMEFASVELPAGLRSCAWLYEFCCEVSPGQQLRLPPKGFLDRVGYAIATGNTIRECEDRLDSVADSIRISGRRID